MSVAKRGEIYWMVFTFNGKRIQQSTRTRNKRDAEEIERAYRTQLAKGEVGIMPKKEVPTFSQAVKEFLVWSKSEHREKSNTQQGYGWSCKSLLLFFKELPLDQIEPQDVERYKIWRGKQPSKNQKNLKLKPEELATISNATINRELACLRIIINRYIKNDFLTKNPVSKVKFLKENLDRWRVLTDKEEELYLTEASQPLQDIATLMLECGCRPEELFRLECKNVNLEIGYLFIPFGKTQNAKRRIPLSMRAAMVLDRRLRENNSKYIFVNERTGNPVTTLKKAHQGALKRSKIDPLRIYDLRHTFASRFVESGGDLITLKDLLGHASLQMVLRYAHPSEEHRFTVIKKMEENRLTKIANREKGEES
jgi:integrase